MDDIPSTIRKAAILVAAVDGRTAELLLAQMGSEEAAAVRRAAAALDDIPAEERDTVLSEFSQLAGSPVGAAKMPLGASGKVRRRFSPQEGLAGIELGGTSPLPLDDDTSAGYGRQECLPHVSSETLADFLAQEQPQTIAVVFTRLPAERAAEVLRRLPSALQIEVVERLASTDRADPQIVRDIERGLEARLSEQVPRTRRGGAGISTATKLLDAASYDLRQTVLSHLARRDTTLARRLAASPLRPAAKLRGHRLTFDDLLQADDTILATVIGAADSHVATLALAGSGQNVMRRLQRRLPGGEWTSLRSTIENLGPTKLSDVEDAQRQLVQLALELESEAKINLSAIRPVDVTA